MQLQLQDFPTIVANAAAAVQGAARQLVDLTVGSTIRAVLEANASLALWLQWLILQVLRTTRAATSNGADLDSWMADFTVARLPPVASTGFVTIGRFTPTAAALVPLGTMVRTADGTQSFAVYADPTNPAYSAAQNGYLLGAGILSVTVPVQASAAGALGNVQSGAISLIAGALPGVDTVTNAAAMQGGLDQESDAALRARFANFLASRSRATPVAIQYAIAGVQQGVQYSIQENATPDGSVRPGTFTVTLDDGSGHPPASLIAAVSAAIDAVRPAGSAFGVLAPTVIPATISLVLGTAPGANRGALINAVTSAVVAYVAALPIGAPLALTRLAQVAYSVDPAITNVFNIQLNGAIADLPCGATSVIKPLTTTVN